MSWEGRKRGRETSSLFPSHHPPAPAARLREDDWGRVSYCRIFGWFLSAGKTSSCCVWTNTGFAYFALAVVFYFFYGQFLPKIISYKVRQAKRAQEGSQNIVPILKNFMLEIHDIYRHFNKSRGRTHKKEETLFRGIYSSDLKAMTEKGIWLKQDKKCSGQPRSQGSLLPAPLSERDRGPGKRWSRVSQNLGDYKQMIWGRGR